MVGAERSQLVKQFLGEAGFFAMISLAIALGIAYLVLPVFNQLSERQLILDLNRNLSLVIMLFLLVLFVGLLAGIYPAVILSSFKPVEVLKGRLFKTSKKISFGRILVTLQFVVSIVLIAATILVNQQLKFLQNKKLGFDKENVVVLTLPKNSDTARLETFKSSLIKNPGIRAVAASQSIPGPMIPVNQVNDGNADLSKALSMQMLFTDVDFIRTMNMKIIAGRDFSNDHPTDRTEGFILNEEAVKNQLDVIENEVGPIDILVNNAGIIKRTPVVDMEISDWEQVLKIDLTGPFIMSKYVGKKMIARGGGKIINICSMMSEVGRETVSAYAAAKGGLKMLTKNMATEWAKHNIQVNGIGPGYFATTQTAPIRVDGHPFNEFIIRRTPAARWGNPEDLQGAVIFLSSKASDFVNGHILYVDGGILASLGKAAHE